MSEGYKRGMLFPTDFHQDKKPEALTGALVSLLQRGNEAEMVLMIICIWGKKSMCL